MACTAAEVFPLPNCKYHVQTSRSNRKAHMLRNMFVPMSSKQTRVPNPIKSCLKINGIWTLTSSSHQNSSPQPLALFFSVSLLPYGQCPILQHQSSDP